MQDRFLATAIVCSVGIHVAIILAPYFGFSEPQKTALLPSSPAAKYPVMQQKGVTAVWLKPPPKKASPTPDPTPLLREKEEPIVTPPTQEHPIYEAAQLTESPEPLGAVPLMSLPSSVSQSGYAELILLIDSQGKVLDITVGESTMAPRALTSTVEAFRETLFRPGTFNGNPVTSRVKIVVSLQNE